jgi:hypothetical protein
MGNSTCLGCLPVTMGEKDIVPHAILFDLDETLIDGTQSIMHYAELLQPYFYAHLQQDGVDLITCLG